MLRAEVGEDVRELLVPMLHGERGDDYLIGIAMVRRVELSRQEMRRPQHRSSRPGARG
jgi:hypothetical protein